MSIYTFLPRILELNQIIDAIPLTGKIFIVIVLLVSMGGSLDDFLQYCTTVATCRSRELEGEESYNWEGIMTHLQDKYKRLSSKEQELYKDLYQANLQTVKQFLDK